MATTTWPFPKPHLPEDLESNGHNNGRTERTLPQRDGVLAVVGADTVGADKRSSSNPSGQTPKSHNSMVKYDVMVSYLRQQQLEKRWAEDSPRQGVVLKKGKDDFICRPAELSAQVGGFFDQVKKLNVKVKGSSHHCSTQQDFCIDL